MSSVPRFFVPPDAITGETVTLPPDTSHHARNVLRLRPGENLIVHDGAGNAYHCVLGGGDGGKIATASIERFGPVATEPRTRITVAQALPKTGEKIEQVLQHGTEAGAAGFTVWAASRSVARLESGGDKVEKRVARWRGIAQGAAEQSGRGVLPEVRWTGTAAELARSFTKYDAVLILHESATVTLRASLNNLPGDASRLLLIVGPEGGLTNEEVARFTGGETAAHGEVVTLGPRILRTETAALVALAQVLYARGE